MPKPYMSEEELHRFLNLSLKASKVASMAVADAKATHDLTKLQIEPLLECLTSLIERVKGLESRVSAIHAKLALLNNVENFNNRMATALDVMDKLIDGKLKTYAEKEN